MPPVLLLEHYPSDGSPVRTYKFTSGMVTVGREEGNDVVIPSAALSRQHAKLLSAGNHWVFCDLGSTNGSWLNEEKLEDNRLVLLRNGSDLTLADAHLSVKLITGPHNPGARYFRSLLIFEEEKFHSEFPFESDSAEFQIGGRDAHLKINGADSLQLTIKAAESGISLSVNDLTLGARLNGEPLSGYTAPGDTALKDGDCIEIGNKSVLVNDSEKALEFHVESAIVPPMPPAYNEEDEVVDFPESVEAVEVPARSPAQTPSWEQTSRKGTEPGKRFIFSEEVGNRSRTVEMPSEKNPARSFGKAYNPPPQQAGFDMNLSRRIATVSPEDQRDSRSNRQRRLILGIALIAFSLVAGLAIVVVVLLN